MRFVRKVLRVLFVLLLILTVWSVVRASAPADAFRREIVVNVTPQVAWDYFSRPKLWVSWVGPGAPTEVVPSEVVGPDTVATFTGGFTFRMTEFSPYTHWMWSAKMGWLTVDYNHAFVPIGDHQTRMVFHQTVTGFGNDILASLLGLVTSLGGHQASLQKLADEINRLPAATER